MSLTPQGIVSKFDWGIPASVLAHAALALLLVYGLPQLHHDPDQAETVDVELVPPPEPEKPHERKKEEEKEEPEKRQEPKQAQKPPEPKPRELEAKRQEAKPPPEPEKPEPSPEQEKEQRRLKALRPVFRFGEKDLGPRAPTGDSTAREAPPAPPAAAQGSTPVEGQAAPAAVEPSPPAEAPATPPVEEARPQPDRPQTQEILQSETGAALPEVPDPAIVPVPEPAPKPPVSRTAQNPPRTAPDLPRAAQGSPGSAQEPQRGAPGLPGTRFQSRSTTDDPLSTTAMGTLPRGLRAGELCATALRLELSSASPPFWPDLLPAYRLDEGTVLEVRKGAFRSNGEWYALGFRCEIDEAATRVVSFTFDVGPPVPRGEWRSRGLSAQ